MGVKYAVNEHFFDVWSPEMAYVLGFMFADGSMEDAPYLRGKYVRVSNTDRDRILAIRKLLRSSHSIITRNKGGNFKKHYLLRIGSHALYDRLVGLGVTPRKSFTMKFPSVPNKYLADFVRGYFDGDGCAYLELDAAGQSRRLVTIFTSGSKPFLESTHSLLVSHAGILGTGLQPHGSTPNAYQLRYSTRDSFRLFVFMYREPLRPELYLKRKYDIFTKFLKRRKLSVRELLSKQQGPMAK